ncbi:MAG TPA: hypothetical protein VG317_13675 [Pseudonocardiaceae bacterium]|nr:hypothetical protein [Pseudonocardiaceae bacterium]
MIGLVRYLLAVLLHSQRYLPALLLYLVALGVLTSDDSGPLVPVYALSAGALFVCGTWLTIALANVPHPVQRAITVVHARGAVPVLVATVLAALLSCAVLAVAGLGFPVLTGGHRVSGAALAVGGLALLACACTAVAVGLLCSRLVIHRPGYALMVALAVVLALLLVRGLPPVNLLLRLLASDDRRPADLLGPVAGLTGLAVGLLLISATATHIVATRRD